MIKSSKILSSQRRDEILKIIEENTYLDMNALSEYFGVSKITIYRDLKQLEKENKLVKIHGGAKVNNSSLNSSIVEPAFSYRRDKNIELKQKAAKNAATFISPGENIILDSSSTSLYIAKEIFSLEGNLTIITNNIDIAIEMMGKNNIQTLLIGGTIRDVTRSTVGPLTLEFLSKINVDKFFFSCAGVAKEKGLTDFNLDEIAVKKVMLKQATKSICVIDHTKIDKIALYPLFSEKEVDFFVTDEKVCNNYSELFRD